jgi:hypothetical protein
MPTLEIVLQARDETGKAFASAQGRAAQMNAGFSRMAGGRGYAGLGSDMDRLRISTEAVNTVMHGMTGVLAGNLIAVDQLGMGMMRLSGGMGLAAKAGLALGAAFAGVVAVGLLSLFIVSAFEQSNLPEILRTEINFDQIDFVSNDQLKTVLNQTSVTPAEVDEAVQINAAARLSALKATFLILAALSLLSILPSLRLPGYTPVELSADDLTHDHPPSGAPART